MKKTFGVMIIALGFAVPVFAQDMSSSTLIGKKDLRSEKKQINKEERSIRREERATRHEEVTYQTRQAFLLDFPNAQDVSYMVGTNFDEVIYRLGDKNYKAYYNREGELVGTTTSVKFNEIPVQAQKEITRKYLDKGYDTDRVILFDDNELVPADMYLYERAFDDEDNYFIELSKPDGKLILQVDMKGNVSYFKELK